MRLNTDSMAQAGKNTMQPTRGKLRGSLKSYIISTRKTLQLGLKLFKPSSFLVVLFLGVLLVSPSVACAQTFTDPTGDLFDSQGRPATGDSYLDIVEVEMSQTGTTYVARMKMAGALPTGVSDSSTFIEWDLLIDADQNPGTHSWGPWPLIDNGIGVDALLRVTWSSSGYSGELLMWPGGTRSTQKIDFKVDGATVEMRVDASGHSVPTAFDLVIAVRKYAEPADKLIVADKCPNEGHLTFFDGKLSLITVKPGLPTEKLQTDHAVVFYNQGNDKYAKYVGQGFEYAYGALQQDFPITPARDFTIYVYLTQDDLVQGLIKFSGFSQESGEFFRQVGGAPRPINYVMHVGPGWDWVGVAHELTHTFIEEYSGRAYLKIKWFDEGLANYESWKCVSSNMEHSQEAESYREYNWKAFSDLKNTKGLFPLSQLSTEAQWEELMTASQPIYPEAFVVVTYLASTYGSSKIIPILEKVQNGTSESDAVRMVLGKTESDILEAVKNAPESAIFGTISTTTATSRISPEQVLNHTISEDLTGPPDYAPVNITHIFSVEDRQVVCQFRIRDIPAGVSFGFRWYSPDDKLYEEYFYPPTSSFSQLITVDRLVEIRGSSAAKMPGKWRVEGYAGNQLLFTDTFTIQSASQTTTASETSPTATVTTTSVSSESYSLLIPIAIMAVLAISLSYVWSRKRSRSRQTAKQGPDTKS